MFRARTRRDGPTKQVSDLNPLWIQGIIPGPPLGGPTVLKPVEGGGMLTFIYMLRWWCYVTDGIEMGWDVTATFLYTVHLHRGDDATPLMLRWWCHVTDGIGVAWGWVGCSRSDGWMPMLWNCYADIRPFMAGSKSGIQGWIHSSEQT